MVCDFAPCEEVATSTVTVVREVETKAAIAPRKASFCARHLDLAQRVGAVATEP